MSLFQENLYEALVEKAAASFMETGMIDIDHAAEAASLGVFIKTFTYDVETNASITEKGN